jgi:murein DD-endopeptidase MepM/ murein hydrolase activator NlpD
MGSFVGPSIAITGMAISGVAAIVTQAMNSRLASVQDGSFVREMIQNSRMPDVFGQYIADSGPFGRGFEYRQVLCNAVNQSRYDCVIGTSVTRPHGGVDIGCNQGTGVHALRTGIIEHSTQHNGYGELILMRHSDGSTSLFAHLNDRLFEKGALVQGGTLIARSGRTSGVGRKPTNPAIQGTDRDPRCLWFMPPRAPRMGAHLHWGIHGVGARKLPAIITDLRRIFNSDAEWNYGTDPIQYIGAHGVRLSLNPTRGVSTPDENALEGLCRFYG